MCGDDWMRDVGLTGCRDVGMSGCRDVGMSGCRVVGMSGYCDKFRTPGESRGASQECLMDKGLMPDECLMNDR
jgi:hypothetical protein